MKRLIVVTIVFLLPLAALCQNNNNNKNNQKKVVNVNKLDVIYQDQDEEYQGVVIDQPEARRNNIPSTLMQPEGEPDEELEASSQMFRQEQMGDGVDSEFDILYATMDSSVIHYASNTELPNGVPIHVTEKEKGR